MKPYLNAVERAIDLHFRSLDYGNVRLGQALDRSDHNMHQTIWKMKVGKQTVAEQQPQQWLSRSDLEAQLGALALTRRQKGGGRVFSKEKHSYFDQDVAESDAHVSGASTRSTDSFDRNGQTSRTHRRRRSSSGDGSPSQSTSLDPSDNDPNDSANSESCDSDDSLEGITDYNQDAVQRRSSIYLTARLRQARARRSIIGSQPSQDQPFSKDEEESKTSVQFADDVIDTVDSRPMPRTNDPPSRPRSAPISRPSHKVGVSVVLPTDLFKSIEESNQTSRAAAVDSVHVSSAIPRASFLQRLRREREMDAKAAALVESIRQTHEQTLRRIKYTGQLADCSDEKSGDKNLFAGVKDKFYTTFGALADISDDIEPMNLQQSLKARPPSAIPRPVLPSEAKSFSRPSTSNSQTFNPRATRNLPASFSLAETEDTYIDIMRIIHLPAVQTQLTPSVDTSPALENEAPSAVPDRIDLPVTASTSSTPSTTTTDLVDPCIKSSTSPGSTAIVNPSVHRNNMAVGTSPSASTSGQLDGRRVSTVSTQQQLSPSPVVNSCSRRASVMQPADEVAEEVHPVPESEDSTLPSSPQISVYAAQRKAHLRSHFITFLACTEPQLWSPDEIQEEMKQQLKAERRISRSSRPTSAANRCRM